GAGLGGGRGAGAGGLGRVGGGATAAPGGGLLGLRTAAGDDGDTEDQERGAAPRTVNRHGTKSFGSRESDARKTRMLARPFSSSARYALRAAVASPPWRRIASCTVGARPSCRYGAVSASPQSGRVRKTRARMFPCGPGDARASPMSWRLRSLNRCTR